MSTAPGRRMHEAAAYIGEHPGCSKSDAARGGKTGPLYSDAVQRLIRGGYVRDEQDYLCTRYQLFLTDAGRKLAGYEAMVS